MVDIQVALNIFMAVLILGTVWRLVAFHLVANPSPWLQHLGIAMNLQY